jgi:hypothetical protein
MAGLVKKAQGLQRFMMDCGFWRSRKWVGADLAAIGLQACGISYSYEHGTDGRLPKDDLALALGVRERDVKAAVAVLIKRDIWREAGGGFEIVGYKDHNPSQSEVEEFRERKSTAGLKGNHVKWHKTKKDPLCPFCESEERPSANRNGTASVIATGSQPDRTTVAEGSQHRIASRVEERRVDPPLSPLSQIGADSPAGAAGPEGEIQDLEPTPPPEVPEPLVERLATLWPNRPRMLAECKLVVGTCLAVADRAIVDEEIGKMLLVGDKPHSPKYLLASVRNRLVGSGAYAAGDEALATLGGRK